MNTIDKPEGIANPQIQPRRIANPPKRGKLLLCCILTVLCFLSYGQKENQLNQMLEKSIKTSKAKYESFAANTTRSHSLLLCCDGLPTPHIKQNKTFYENIGLETITWHNAKKHQKDLETGIDIIEVHYYLKGNQFEIYVHFLTATKENEEIFLAYWFEDIDKYVYEYSCETDEWVLVK